jgi:hypothetical protein
MGFGIAVFSGVCCGPLGRRNPVGCNLGRYRENLPRDRLTPGSWHPRAGRMRKTAGNGGLRARLVPSPPATLPRTHSICHDKGARWCIAGSAGGTRSTLSRRCLNRYWATSNVEEQSKIVRARAQPLRRDLGSLLPPRLRALLYDAHRPPLLHVPGKLDNQPPPAGARKATRDGATFYTTEMEHSPTSATGTGWGARRGLRRFVLPVRRLAG